MMRMQSTVLLAIIVFYVIIGAVTALKFAEQASILKLSAGKRSVRFDNNAATRLLRPRAASVVDERANDLTAGDETRTNVLAVSKLADLDKKTSRFRKWDIKVAHKLAIVLNTSPKWTFKFFCLDRARKKIGENKRIIQWFRYVQSYRAAKGEHWFPDYDIFVAGQGRARI